MIALVLLAQFLAGSPPPRPVTPRIAGVVRYADGRGVANCRVVVLHPAFDSLKEVRCDARGHYELSLEAGTYNAIAILDEGYGKTTLEFWAWNVQVSGDLVLDATIDRLEVYNLSVWNSKGGAPSMFLSFRPMSLERALAGASPEPRVVAGDTLMVVDISPALKRQDLVVTIDGVPTEVESLQWYYERYLDKAAGGHRSMPVGLLQVARPALKKGLHVVRVRVTDASTRAIGEAVTYFTSNEAGLGF
jgi:hypothetical protein